MNFKHNKPFRDTENNVVTMKDKRTIHDQVDIHVYENTKDYRPEELTPMTDQEYQEYLLNDFE